MNIPIFWFILFVYGSLPAKLICEDDEKKIAIFGSIKDLNELADKLGAGAEAGSNELGKRVATSFTVASEWDKAINTLGELKDAKDQLNSNSTHLKESALAAITKPTSENIRTLKKISQNFKNIHLRKTQLSASLVIGVLTALHYRFGEFEMAQFIGDPVFQDTDKDFKEFSQKMIGIGEATENIETSIQTVSSLTEENSVEFVSEIMRLAFTLEREAAEFDNQIKSGLVFFINKLESFSEDLSDEVNGLRASIDVISKDIKAGISSILLGQIEADTKPARDCYRRIANLKFSTMVTQIRRKKCPDFGCMKIKRRRQLLEHLHNSDYGVDSCLRKLRSVYDPATGPPTNPRDLFYKVRERFLTEFRDPATWSDKTALGELRRFELMARQLLLQLSSLLILKYLALVAGNSWQEIDEEGLRTFRMYNEGIQLIKQKYFENFPDCKYLVAINKPIRSMRMICESPRVRNRATQSQETSVSCAESSDIMEEKVAKYHTNAKAA